MENMGRSTIINKKLLKCLLVSSSRFKRIKRTLNMRSLRITISLGALGTAAIALLYTIFSHVDYAKNNVLNISNVQEVQTEKPNQYYKPMEHIPLEKIYKNDSKYNHDNSVEFEDIKEDQVLDTPGCRIPLSVLSYISKKKHYPRSCGERTVYLKKLEQDKIKILIKDRSMRKLLKNNSTHHCCYRFFETSSRTMDSNSKLKYSECRKFQDSDTFYLEGQFINIQCFQDKMLIYNDVYAFIKKKKIDQTHYKKCKHKYNVLMVGMDSMSMPRFTQTMRKTTLYLKNNAWLAYRGYNKVGDNTLPNLVASFTGLDMDTFSKKCSDKMDKCNDLFIWNHFKNAGYITAYGEDYLRLPDTFSREYLFHHQPTDHYMKPFFLSGENEIYNGSFLCAGKLSSGQQLLDYALDFALTYRSNNFFGVFWMNSFSHNIKYKPEEADTIFENFFNRLFYTGIFENTFIIFFSDHGLRFGIQRLKIESYYDNRLPFLFIWTPPLFRGKHSKKFNNIAANRFRLTTPYDLYNTISEINHISSCNTSLIEQNPKSQSLFNVVRANRTCEDVGIHEKWCSCHQLYSLDVEDVAGVKNVEFAVSIIQSKIRTIKTKQCMKCASLYLKNITRIHYYLGPDKVNYYYVVAFEMGPEKVYYEAIILRTNTNLKLVGPISILSVYSGFGKCTVYPKDKIFCVCQKQEGCKEM